MPQKINEGMKSDCVWDFLKCLARKFFFSVSLSHTNIRIYVLLSFMLAIYRLILGVVDMMHCLYY